jgi:hypothetical protein
MNCTYCAGYFSFQFASFHPSHTSCELALLPHDPGQTGASVGRTGAALPVCFGCNFQSKQSRPTTATRQQRPRKRQVTTFGHLLGLCTARFDLLGFTRSFLSPFGASHNLRAASKHNIAHTLDSTCRCHAPKPLPSARRNGYRTNENKVEIS